MPNEGAPGPWLRDQLRAHSRPQAGGGVSNVHAFSHQAGVCRWRLQLSSWLGSRFRGPGSISLILTWGSEQVGQLLSPPPIANKESSVWSGRLFVWLGALLLLGYR